MMIFHKSHQVIIQARLVHHPLIMMMLQPEFSLFSFHEFMDRLLDDCMNPNNSVCGNKMHQPELGNHRKLADVESWIPHYGNDLKDSEDKEGHVDDGMIVVLAGSRSDLQGGVDKSSQPKHDG